MKNGQNHENNYIVPTKQTIIAMYKDGAKIKDIAKAIGKSREWVSTVIKNNTGT